MAYEETFLITLTSAWAANATANRSNKRWVESKLAVQFCSVCIRDRGGLEMASLRFYVI